MKPISPEVHPKDTVLMIIENREEATNISGYIVVGPGARLIYTLMRGNVSESKFMSKESRGMGRGTVIEDGLCTVQL